ncbi:MAG: glucose-6-phosphate isomerase [Coriobacteriia bacterium]|nr:glucose-6-phosphate isomerase [Coriobacteriia bacterium]
MAARDRLIESDAVRRLRDRDASLFSADLDQRIPIMQRLGWTDLAAKATNRIPLLIALAESIATEGATDILLLGMGGSSLAPLVMTRIIGPVPGNPCLHVLDTTSPVQTTELLDTLDPQTTYVVVASKSGTTIEPLSLYAVVRAWFEHSGMEKPAIGRRIIVITDAGSPLEKLRQRDMLRTVLTAPATVGGRYSALSLFGLAPAALAGVHLQSLVPRAQAMEAACGTPVDENPAALLAAWMADAWDAGRDKLTFVTSERYASFGLWAEQLVAESLGKDGIGIVPVLEPEPADPDAYGSDRAFVVLRFGDDTELSDWSRTTAAVHPVFELTVTDIFDIGAEFVRWEHAVALTSVLLGVNPFDEPSVTEAKQATSTILDGGASEVPTAAADLSGTWVTCAGELACPSPSSRLATLRRALAALQPADYLALLVYAPDDPERLQPLQEACAAVSHATGHAVCLEIGPRYLHSTGQLHKGGPNTGVFILITARDRTDVPIPGKPFGLAALHRAQAEGDLMTLAHHGRRVLRLDLPSTSPAALAALADEFTAAARH